MNGNHNPGVIPGYYNPQQAKTEVGDYQAFLGSDFVDPTQIPMHPGDTQRPMQPPPVYPAIQKQVVSEQTNSYRVQSQVTHQKYQDCMEHLYQNIPKTIEPVRIPILIELTINLNINHAGNT